MNLRAFLAAFTCFAGSSLAARAAWPQAAVPSCDGNDHARAEAAREEGLAHYRASRNGTSVDAAGIRRALESFARQCAAGDDNALEYLAYAWGSLNERTRALAAIDEF